MKLIEFLSEDKMESWTKIKDYEPSTIKGKFTDKNSLRIFLKGNFINELKKLLSFLTACEYLMKENKYPHKYIQATKMLAGKLTSVIDSTISEELAPANKILIINKLNRAAFYFKNIGHNFDDIGEEKLAYVCLKLNTLLEKSANEVSAI